MMKYPINDIYYSIQGEGIRVGTPNVFIRFAHCNLSCPFCDTDYDIVRMELDEKEIVDRIWGYRCPNVILTGGEPAMYDLHPLCRELKRAGFYIAIETNGMFELPKEIDFICVSPKTDPRTLKVKKCDELKYVIKKGDPLPQPSLQATHYWLSPLNEKHSINWENVRYCIELIKRNSKCAGPAGGPSPLWRLNMQLHKILGIP